MKKISRYFFSTALFCFLFNSSYSQTERIKGLRVGIDISRFALYYLEPERKCIEASADFEVLHNLYPILEIGQQKVSINKIIINNKSDGSFYFNSGYNYKSDGSYYRIGTDYNFLKIKANNQYDMLFIGLRYGSAVMSHSSENIIVGSGYWGNFTNGSVPETKIFAHWVEVAGGIRAEVFNNFFMGWSFSGRIMLKKTENQYMNAYNIPGFGSGTKNSGIGFNYSIYFRIPILRVAVKPARTDENK